MLTDMSIQDFVDKFVADFDDYAKHLVESWFLNAVKNVAFSPTNQPSHEELSLPSLPTTCVRQSIQDKVRSLPP